MAGAALLLGGTIAFVGLAPEDPMRWHVDPLTATRPGTPNDALAAPAGVTSARPDRDVPVFPGSPDDLLARLDQVASASPRTAQIAGSVAEGRITYRQRSAVFGFPDYVTVTAVEVEGGAAPVLWSRSRYGYSDLGVNRARIDRWIAALGD